MRSSYTLSAADANKYRFNGKELQTEMSLNMLDFGAQNYDAAWQVV